MCAIAYKDMKEIYVTSAKLFESARDELFLDGITGVHREFIELKFMGCLIHNEICREFHNLTGNPTIGASKLLALGPIILKLFEANLWYSQVGNRMLRELAQSRGMLEFFESKYKEMKLIRPSRIEMYAGIRNQLAAHYDDHTPTMFQKLGAIEADAFFEDIEMMVRYSQEWLQVLTIILNWKSQNSEWNASLPI